MHLITKVSKSAVLLKWANMWKWVCYYKATKNMEGIIILRKRKLLFEEIRIFSINLELYRLQNPVWGPGCMKQAWIWQMSLSLCSWKAERTQQKSASSEKRMQMTANHRQKMTVSFVDIFILLQFMRIMQCPQSPLDLDLVLFFNL